MQPSARDIRRHALLLLWSLACVAWLNAVPAFAQGIITTVAGNGEHGFWGNGGGATSTPLNLGPYTGGVAVDAAGNLYIADTGSHRVYKVSPNGQRFTVAGSDCWVCAPEEQLAGDPRAGFSGDGGQAFNALLNSPSGLGIDAVGNLYIVDAGNQRIRKVSPDGIITSVAGNGRRGFSGDGAPAINASLNLASRWWPTRYSGNVAVDAAGNLYIADTGNGRIRKVTPDGIITSVAHFDDDLFGVAVDLVGNIYITRNTPHFGGAVQKITPGGTLTAITGFRDEPVPGPFGPFGDGGLATDAWLLFPTGVAVDTVGNVYIADGAHRIRKVDPEGKITTVAGSGNPVFTPPDPILGEGGGYIVEGGFSGDGGLSNNAKLNAPWGVVVDATGNVYIADSLNNRIRKVTAAIGSSSSSIEDAQFFVGQHYRDFLNREPDTDGLAFWTNEITSCLSDAQCVEAKRINVSAAYFLSIEFQQTGYLVYRMYKASYGNLPSAPVPIRRSEFLPDTQQIGQGVIVNQTRWEQVLDNNKQAFATEFVQRSRFSSAFPASMTPDAFVDTLFANAGVVPAGSDRAAAIGEFGSAATTADVAARARALRRVAENSTLAQQEFNRAFVLMQYFGYLRRNPNDPPEPTLDFQGYNFWLGKLDQFNGNFQNAEMVKAFIVSSEYRQRFGP